MQSNETTPEASSAETATPNLERAPAPPTGSQPAVPLPTSHNTVTSQPATTNPDPVATGAPAPAPDSPASANDTDEIESVWVDQADKIIDQNQNDPYTQEEAVESLSKDYLKKRFGIDVNKT